MKLICPDCGAQYESGKFCLECGTKLQEVAPELVCPSCGYKAKIGKFCPECGTKLIQQVAAPKTTKNQKPAKPTFNEKDPRFAKYYDKKGFPRTIPQEERAVAIEELTPFAGQNIAEAKMLLGGILMSDSKNKEATLKGTKLIKEAEEAGDKLAYYRMGIVYLSGYETVVEQNHDEAERRLLEAFHEYQDGDIAGFLAGLYTYSEEKCDYKKAFDYATIAAEDDESDGYFVLGALYLNGWGVEKNVNLALDNYKMAAAYGDEGAMNQIGFIYMGNDDFEENPEQAFYWFNEAAKKGDDVGMNNLGCCYKNGFGVEEDVEKAAEWFKKSADLGYVDAMIELGDYYQGVLVDHKKAKMWYLKAAELGNAEAQNKLGVFYADVENDYKEAIKWYKKAIEQDYPNAYRNLGICYRDGNGVKQDLKKAEELFSKASELGVEDANEIKDNMVSSQEDEDAEMHNALDAYNNGDYETASSIWKKWAERGNAVAMAYLGDCYRDGEGVAQDCNEAAEWYRKAADLGNDYAMANLGDCYLNGNGVSKNYREAVKWYKKAGQLGNAYAYMCLADTSESPAEAVQWWLKAAELGNAEACRNLGVYYESSDIKKAIEWCQKALDNGYEDEDGKIESILNSLKKNNLKKTEQEVELIKVWADNITGRKEITIHFDAKLNKETNHVCVVGVPTMQDNFDFLADEDYDGYGYRGGHFIIPKSKKELRNYQFSFTEKELSSAFDSGDGYPIIDGVYSVKMALVGFCGADNDNDFEDKVKKALKRPLFFYTLKFRLTTHLFSACDIEVIR